ncbi:MAG: Verru_Chthon cassette protein A [Verrucomicrobiaceae bacterium]|nr:Verru_Chthon cassette protein A [Verrucomicrobiaceae bacterium]
MKLATLLRLARRDRGMALVIVISALALISILIIAIFSVTRREYKATQSFVNARSAKQLGDMATAIVTAQIQNGHNTVTGATGRTIHATQPGMVRKYNSDGSFNSAYKLYSSTQMKVIGGDEAVLLSPPHVTPSAWNTQPARYVDLNEPVIRPGSAAADGDSAGYAVYFPIIDPRAFYNSGSGGQNAASNGAPGTTQIEGFSYDKKTAESGSGASQDYSARTTTPDAAANAGDVRLPMPVEWMYVLQDGTMGSLDDNNTFISAGAAPTPQNPIVGRIAFWTDDESCKININTASEPTFAASPFYYHERDMRWAHYPGATGEYQRYPGHPATVALSAVLAPYYTLDPMSPAVDGLTQSQVVEIKENIYELLPKVHTGAPSLVPAPSSRIHSSMRVRPQTC